MNQSFISKGEGLFTTIGIVSGVVYSYKKNQNMNQVLINSAIFGLCGYLIGTAITKFYE